MVQLIKKLVTDESAQDLAEYGIALAVIGALVAGAAIAISNAVENLWTEAQTVVQQAADAQ